MEKYKFSKIIKYLYESLFDNDDDLLDDDESVFDKYTSYDHFFSTNDLVNFIDDKTNIPGALLFKRNNVDEYIIDNYKNPSLDDDIIMDIYDKYENEGFTLFAVCFGKGLWCLHNWKYLGKYINGININLNDIKNVKTDSYGYINTLNIINYFNKKYKHTKPSTVYDYIQQDKIFNLYIPSYDEYNYIKETFFKDHEYFVTDIATIYELNYSSTIVPKEIRFCLSRVKANMVYLHFSIVPFSLESINFLEYDDEDGLELEYDELDYDDLNKYLLYEDHNFYRCSTPFIKFKNVTISI